MSQYRVRTQASFPTQFSAETLPPAAASCNHATSTSSISCQQWEPQSYSSSDTYGSARLSESCDAADSGRLRVCSAMPRPNLTPFREGVLVRVKDIRSGKVLAYAGISDHSRANVGRALEYLVRHVDDGSR